MPYFDTPEKKKNREIYKDTIEFCNNNETLKSAIEKTIQNQQIVLETDAIDLNTSTYEEDCKVIFANTTSFKAAMRQQEGKICVLNFASFTKAGGGVAFGSKAQEESLCRISTLMSCLSDKNCKNKYYEPHKKMNYPLQNDDMIYSPGIIVFKEDSVNSDLMPEDKWLSVDIISSAAPNFMEKPSNRYNPSDGDSPIRLTNDELKALLVKRIERMFEIVHSNGAEIFIVGAFGCGAFHNPPKIVAAAFDIVIKKYSNWFKKIIFAVPGADENSRVFKEWFGHSREVALAAIPQVVIPEIPNLKSKKLNHKTFGEGIITDMNDRILVVDFNGEVKKLKFEFVFSGVAHLEDAELDAKVCEIAEMIKQK